MKKSLLIALLIPSLSFAQKFEVSEMGGYSSNQSTPFFENNGGYCNQLSVCDYIAKYTSVGVYYELNSWNPSINTIGLLADFHGGHLYFGVSAGEVFFDTKKIAVSPLYYLNSNTNYIVEPSIINIKVNPAIALGAHVGLTQKLYKHFSVKEQVGYSYAHSNGNYENDNFSLKMRCLSALAGIAYHF